MIRQTLANGDVLHITYNDAERKSCMEYSDYPEIKECRYNEERMLCKVIRADGSENVYDYDEQNNRILDKPDNAKK